MKIAVVGGGHNGLVAAAMLARGGHEVEVLEAAEVAGGAARTERPFAKAPNLGTSTGAYLLGLMPPELMAELGVELEVELLRRDPHYFLPTTGEGYLLFGSDRASTRRQYEAFFSASDWEADQRMQTELAALREDLAPAWLAEPLSVEETAERYIRRDLREVFVGLCTGPVGEYIERFGFASELVKAMYAVTDAYSGSTGGWSTPGSGMNFLVHNMCRLPGGDGTWMIAKGGMGAVASALRGAAERAGARVTTSARVEAIEAPEGRKRLVRLAGGEEREVDVVVCGCDPYTMRDLVGREALGAELNAKLDEAWRPGCTLKVNLALDGLPTFTCLPEDRGQFGTTTHLLPQGEGVLARVEAARQDALSGRLADFPTIEWYIHTTVDPSLKDEHGHHNSALFVQWAPYEVAGSSWEDELDGYVDHLLGICDTFAPDTSSRVVDVMALTPKGIEEHFGIQGGHIHHIDNLYGFDQRAPYATGVEGLYCCSAACHPAGSVIGAAGHNAAVRVLADLG
jgi:phytoene dehydrogenase-like protein